MSRQLNGTGIILFSCFLMIQNLLEIDVNSYLGGRNGLDSMVPW